MNYSQIFIKQSCVIINSFEYLSLLAFQAQLNEIITAGTKLVHDYVSSELPWMIDGAGLPPHADEHLPELVLTFFSANVSLLASFNLEGFLAYLLLKGIYFKGHRQYHLSVSSIFY